MSYLSIKGGNRLSGEINISGAKNSALPLITASILAKDDFFVDNIPDVADVNVLLNLIENLGGEYKFQNNELKINTNNMHHIKAVYDIVKTMRASILVLGPLLARFGEAMVSLPGGCAIGERPVDLHLKALEKMGAIIKIESGYIHAIAPSGTLRGAEIIFDKITVTGSENIIMAASLADGVSKLINVAKEPEVVQLCELLQSSGVDIKGVGTSELEICGTNKELINFKKTTVIPDRIEAATYLCAGAITRSNLTINKVNHNHLNSFLDKLSQMGFELERNETSIEIHPVSKIKPIEIVTTEYPGFPTDIQAQITTLATQADGTSTIEEKLFENRFMHIAELRRMGANIHLNGHTATIMGNSELFGTDVMATDLRASSALVLAGLIAKGDTNIHRIYHLHRGYENLEEKLRNIGANIKLMKK